MKIVSTLLLLALCLSLLLTSCSLSDLFPKNETESQTKGETDAQTIETDGKGSETATETEPDHESETAAEETNWRYTTEGIVACFNRYEYKKSWYDEEFRNYLKEHTEYLTGNVLAMVQITDQITENEEDRTYADVVELENEADAIAYAEDRAKALAETEGENALCLRYGRIVVFGTSPILSRIQAGTVTHPTVEQVVEKFDEDVFELEWMNKTLIAFQENALNFLKGHILTVARLTDTKAGSEEWAGICEFELEEDAMAYAADRTAYLEENEPGKGICFQYGCIVVFGTANVLNEIKPAD